MVKLTEIVEQSMANDFSVRSVFLNPSHVVMVREDNKLVIISLKISLVI